MAEVILTQSEADDLFAMEKLPANGTLSFPKPGEAALAALHSIDGREAFLLDVSRGRIKLTKATYQARAKQVVVLARVDLEGPPHRNPDGDEIPCPHLHLYREGFADKWAVPLPANFSDSADLLQTLEDFCRFCNIIGLRIERALPL